MNTKLVLALIGLSSTLAWSQYPSSMLGTWKGVSNSAVSGVGLFHPTEEGKEKAVRFRNVDYVLVIDKEENRNFVGSIGVTNAKHLSDVKHKEVILGAYAKDMNSGVMVNETGNFTFKLADGKTLEVCYTQVSSKPKVASCFEMFKQ